MKKNLVLVVLLSLLLSLTALAYNGDTIVYITESGTKYHSYGCSYLAKSCYEITLEEAANSGYDRCSRCNPPIPDFEVQGTPKPERDSSSSSSTRSSTDSSTKKAAVDDSSEKPIEATGTKTAPKKTFWETPVTESAFGRLAIGIPAGIVLLFVVGSILISVYEGIADRIKRKH